MWRLMAILLIFSGLTAAMIDMTNICMNSRSGDLVANPYDCQSYFICSTVPTLLYCDEGLHFDAKRKACNWPKYAACKLETTLDVTAGTEELVAEAQLINKPKPVFMAIDTSSGLIVDPMKDYDPEYIACRHFGAYFLPHPRSCRKYYLCAYGYLHQHHCGSGTYWNYKRSECELSEIAECYNPSAAEEDLDSNTRVNVSSTSSTMHTFSVCYTISTVPAETTTDASWQPTGESTWYPTGTYHTGTPTDTTWYPTGSYHTATPTQTPTKPWQPTGTQTDSTWYPTGSYHTAITEPTKSSSTPRVDDLTVECPGTRQAYLPHPKDCSKYYICIVGMPVLTSCPNDLYWDQKAEFCDLAKNVKCTTKTF